MIHSQLLIPVIQLERQRALERWHLVQAARTTTGREGRGLRRVVGQIAPRALARRLGRTRPGRPARVGPSTACC